MAVIKSLLFGVVALAVVHQMGADPEPSGGWQFPSFQSNFGGFQLPSIPGFSGFNSSGLLAFPFQLPNSISSLIPSRNGEALLPLNITSRKRRSPDGEEAEAAEHQNRLFFSLFPTVTRCNFTATPGYSCPSCRISLRCLGNNVGLRTRCSGLFRYCNNGRCSLTPGSACTTTTTTSNNTNSSG